MFVQLKLDKLSRYYEIINIKNSKVYLREKGEEGVTDIISIKSFQYFHQKNLTEEEFNNG